MDDRMMKNIIASMNDNERLSYFQGLQAKGKLKKDNPNLSKKDKDALFAATGNYASVDNIEAFLLG